MWCKLGHVTPQNPGSMKPSYSTECVVQFQAHRPRNRCRISRRPAGSKDYAKVDNMGLWYESVNFAVQIHQLCRAQTPKSLP